MLHLLWIVPALPLLGAAILMITGGTLPPRAVTMVGVGSVAISAIISVIIAVSFLTGPSHGGAFTQILWQWIAIGSFKPQIGLYLDPLSLVMMLVVTVVGFLIHLYSSEFMQGDEGYNRFFAYMNLFVVAMLVLVLAGNLLFLFVGWEGVGLCSYFLIGFWYRESVNGSAARKAFIVTRVGDAALMIGLFLLFNRLGTLEIQPLLNQAVHVWPKGSVAATIITALLLGGAVGKSAQFPLQTWLPDAMAGPSPVSALIHAATMVTAGVYLIARMHVLYEIAPAVQIAVAAVGAATLLIAAFAALNQSDLKRILAYSTMSQIGYMFLALGVGAWTAAIFHLVMHAFFKALLFLSAGAITMRLHHEQDIFRMGGLARRLPVAFWSFLIGSASLAALPLITAGFYSKEMILSQAWFYGGGGRVLWGAGIVGSFVTAIYIFRAVFIAFFGAPKTEVSGTYGPRIVVPLVVLSVLALIGGFIEMPRAFGNVSIFSHLLTRVFAGPGVAQPAQTEALLLLVGSLVALSGIAIAYFMYFRQTIRIAALTDVPALVALRRFLLSGWGFDRLYDGLIVKPFLWITQVNRNDVIDSVFTSVAFASGFIHRGLQQTQTGRLRWYAGWVAAGSVALIAIAAFA